VPNVACWSRNGSVARALPVLRRASDFAPPRLEISIFPGISRVVRVLSSPLIRSARTRAFLIKEIRKESTGSVYFLLLHFLERRAVPGVLSFWPIASAF